MPARILIIEDNQANMELMAYLLKAYGHEPLLARNGLEGIELARDVLPDLVICDVHLPQIDGYGVVGFLKSHAVLGNIPVIAVTALAMVGDEEKLLAAGFDGYVSKPIDPEKFVPLIEGFLRPDCDRNALREQPHGAASSNRPSNSGIARCLHRSAKIAGTDERNRKLPASPKKE